MANNVDNHSRLWWAIFTWTRTTFSPCTLPNILYEQGRLSGPIILYCIWKIFDLVTIISSRTLILLYLARRTTVGAVSQQKARKSRPATAWSSAWCGTWPTPPAPRAPLAARQLFTLRRMPRALSRFPSTWVRISSVFFRVADPDPPDPYVFGPPGSRSISQRYGSGFGFGSGSFYHHAKIVRKTLIPTIMWLFLKNLKNDVNLPSKSNKQNFFFKISFLFTSWGSMMKILGSGSISQRHGSADPDPDPDPHQNVMDPQH